ncbi:MAG: hypothetical protein Q7U47_10355 [Paludibacter sp.]|nr:hypothetical protein [Paludibacter sp.]
MSITPIITIRGDVTVKNTGSGRWQFGGPAASASVTVNIGGNLVIDGSASSATALVSVTSNGTSNANTHIVVNIQGNTIVTGNPANNAWTNFSISRGSQGGSGTSTWNFYGNVSVSDAQIQNSTTTTSGGLGKWVFAKSGTQTLALSNINSTAAPFNIDVLSGSNLNIGNSTLTPSSGFFTLNPGAGIMTSHVSGLNGNLTNTGAKTLNTAANYTFNGSSAQVSGALMPAIVNNLTINNTAGVSPGATLTVTTALGLQNGTLNIGAYDLTIGAAGSISGGSASSYIVTGAGKLIQSVAAGAPKLFPVGSSSSSYDPALLTPTDASLIAVNVGTTLPAAVPSNYFYNEKVWDITPESPSATVITLTPSVAMSTIISDVIGNYSGGVYVNKVAVKSGNAYTATFSSFSPFVTGTTDLGTSVVNNLMNGVTFDGKTIRNADRQALRVFDTAGRLVVSSKADINMSTQAKGIYIVKAENGMMKIALTK